MPAVQQALPPLTEDERYMRMALEASRSVEGRTGDNPPVGCVIVRDGLVLATGVTQPPGQHHAEVMAVLAAEAAGHSVADADVYVTLEPCAFTGRTPPCSRLLAERRPRRVIVATIDPHPLVRGAGIAVRLDVLARPVREFLAGWLARFGESVEPGA